MSDLIVNVQIPGNMTLENTVIPADYLTEHIISELLDELSLPRITEDGQIVEYVLFWLNRRETLLAGRSLLVSGVQNGDTIKLVSSHDVETEASTDTGENTLETSDDGFIEVILSVLDINKSERVMLELDREVGNILQQICHTYNLPSRGKFDELVTYHLTSKALGKRLDRSATLRQERIPHLDRLTITRDAVAGGGGISLKVDVGASGIFIETFTPDHRQIRFVIQELVNTLGLDETSSNGERIQYLLLHGRRLTALSVQDTLHKAGVRDGDTIRLISDRQRSEQRTKTPGWFKTWLKSLSTSVEKDPAFKESEPEPSQQNALRAGPHSFTNQSDPVNCTVFAPSTIRQGGSCLVQVFAHLLDQTDEAKAAAIEFDEDAERRGSKSLEMDIERGATLSFHLLAPGFEVDDPIQRLVWRGSTESVQFGLSAPKDQWLGNFVATVRISYDQIPLGHIKFKIAVVGPDESTEESGLTGEACIYRTAFVSYASPDRVEVLKRVQMLARLRINVFQDILNLEPGERWERILYRRIDDSDLFLLFWSSAAKNSHWVMKEVRYALWLKKGDDQAPPEVIPIVIEGPPIVAPPDDLAHLHFNDQFLYFISGS